MDGWIVACLLYPPIPCIFLRWKRGEPRKLFLMELRRVFQGIPPMEGLGGGVGLGVPAGLSLGVWTGVPLGVGIGLPLGEGWGVTCIVGIDLVVWSELGIGWKWCSRIGERGTTGLKGTESWGGMMEAGVARRTSGLPGIQGAWGWHGVEGSDLTVEMCSGSDSGRGFDRADCKGMSLGLAGRVWVFGQGRRDSDIEFGVR